MFQIRSAQLAAMRRKKLGDTLIDRLQPFVTATWDAQGSRVLLRDGSGPRGSLRFDSLGFIGSFESPLGRVWQLTNAADGKLLEMASPSGHVLSMGYDAEGLLAAFASTTQTRIDLQYQLRHLTATRYADGTAETVGYTSFGDASVFTTRLGRGVHCVYDNYRRLTGITDGNGHTTQFSYDRWNRPETVLHPNGQRETFAFDREGKLARMASGDAVATEVESDSQGRPLRLVYEDGFEAKFGYGEGGLLTEAFGPAGGSTFTYDEHGQFISEVAGSYTHRCTYDAGKRVESITSLGATVHFHWDADSRLAGFTDWSGGKHNFEYLPSDRGHVMTGPVQAGSPGVRTFLRTDTAGRLADLQVFAAGQTRFSLACTYDREGRLSTAADSISGQRAFGYDTDDRIQYADAADSTRREVFTYDGASNLAAINGSRLVYDAANQLLEVGKTSLRWDDRGNLLETAGPEGLNRFRYNLRNQLTAFVNDDGQETTYTYDALGRRTGKQTGAVETRFFWLGEQMTCQIRADLETGALCRQDFLYHPETGAPIATAVDGEVFTIHTDHLGTPRAVVSGTGEVVWLAELSAFGMARVVVDRVPMPLRFRGQYFDAETGLHYNRFRYYAPQWGRYITRDPLTFAAGTNHYAYAEANPLNQTDATGLFSWKGAAVFAGSAAAAVAVGAAVVAFAPAIGLAGLGLAVVAGIAAGAAAGATGTALNEKLNGQNLCWPCIFQSALLGGVAGGVAGAVFLLVAPALGAVGAGGISGAAAYLTNCLDGAEKNPSLKGLAFAVAGGAVFGGAAKGVNDYFGSPATEAAPEATPESEVPPAANDNVPPPDPPINADTAGPGEPANDNVAPPGKAANDNYVASSPKIASDSDVSPGEAANDNLMTTTEPAVSPAPTAAPPTSPAADTPAQEASAWQGTGSYPGVDAWTNVPINKGDLVVGAVPGQGDFYTDMTTFNSTDGTAAGYYDKMQIAPNLSNPAYPPYRSGVTVYRVDADGMAATSQTLANPTLGAGNGTQYYIPGSSSRLTPLYSIPFKP